MNLSLELESDGSDSSLGESLEIKVSESIHLYAINRDADGNFVENIKVQWLVKGNIGSLSLDIESKDIVFTASATSGSGTIQISFGETTQAVAVIVMPDDFITAMWDFLDPNKYSFDSFIDIIGQSAKLKSINQFHSGIDFNGGNHTGTRLDGNDRLTLKKGPTDNETHVNTILASKASDLVLYLRMEGDFTDSGALGNTGVANGNPTFSSLGRIGDQSGVFDGTGDSVTTPVSISSFVNGFTWSYWVQTNNLGGTWSWPVGASQLAGVLQNFRCGKVTGSGSIQFEIGDFTSNNILIASTNMADGNWHQIACVWDRVNGFKKIFLDGQIVASTAVTLVDVSGDYGNLQIGSDAKGEDWNGELDDVAIWTTALSDDEVLTLYNGQNSSHTELSGNWTPNYSNLVGHWKMDGNWRDSSGQANHGVAVNTVGFSSNHKVGSHAGTFSGADCSLVVDSNSLDITSQITVMSWIRADDYNYNTDSGAIVRKDSAYSLYFTVAFAGEPQGLQMYLWGLTTPRIGYDFTNFDNTQWYHVAGVYNGATSKLYVNGQEVASINTTGSISSTGTNLAIGARSACDDYFWNGELDEAAVWNTALSLTDISEIYQRQKQKYAGHYDSPIIDIGTSAPWESLSGLTTLPFNKPIVVGAAESTSQYSALLGDLTNGLMGYWPLDEITANSAPGATDFEDKSGNGNHGNVTGGVIFGRPGLIGKSIRRNGGVGSIELGAVFGAIPTTYTTCGWFYINNYDTSGTALIGGGTAGTDNRNFGTTILADGTIEMGHSNSVWLTSSPGEFSLGQWTHLCHTWNGVTHKMFHNGYFNTSVTPPGPPNVTHNTVYLGDLEGTTTWELDGNIDELAIWNRALSDDEVRQLFRRTANRVKYQVKSCVDPNCECRAYSVTPLGGATDCNGDGLLNAVDSNDSFSAQWIGKDGTNGSTFSERQNCAAPDVDGNCPNGIKETAPIFNFGLFPPAQAPMDNRYFQYRILLEAEDNKLCNGNTVPCMPELSSIELGPSPRYYGVVQIITADEPINYTDISSLSVSATGSCTQTYQLSPDGPNFYYWNGSTWLGAVGIGQSNSAAVSSANISSFVSQFGAGNLTWKGFMLSDTSQSCSIDKVTVEVIQ